MKQFRFSQKIPNVVIFMDLMQSDRKIWLQTFFVKILKVLSIGFVYVPNLGQMNFKSMEQKGVQRCETKVNADACKASYQLTCILIKLVHKAGTNCPYTYAQPWWATLNHSQSGYGVML